LIAHPISLVGSLRLSRAQVRNRFGGRGHAQNIGIAAEKGQQMVHAGAFEGRLLRCLALAAR
jgi:hypothetical protein